jgi:type VI secretion system secreted protein VgrG
VAGPQVLAGSLLANDDLGFPTATIASIKVFGKSKTGTTGTTFTLPLPAGGVSLASGALIVNADGSFSLTNPAQAGQYTFEYTLVNDGGSDHATVTITVNAAPIAANDAFSTVQNCSSFFFFVCLTTNASVTADLLADNGAGQDNLGYPSASVISFGGGSLGGNSSSNSAGQTATVAGGVTVSVAANGALTFTRAGVISGEVVVTLEYVLQNDFGTSTGTVTITVQAFHFQEPPN